MMRSINENVGKFAHWVTATILDTISEAYVERLVEQIKRTSTTNEECCEYLLQLLN